jgi:D-3-phosphoglycerate dehydrogenase
MKVQYCDPFQPAVDLLLEFQDGQSVEFSLKHTDLTDLLKTSDYITLHAPAQEKPLIGPEEFQLIKEGAGLVNAARGGLVDELALLEALASGKISFAGLDVYQSEPRPEVQLLMHPDLSLSPHIGAATEEAQIRIGTEMAHKIIHRLKKDK